MRAPSSLLPTLAAVAVVCGLFAPRPAAAGKPKRYHIALTTVRAAEGLPPETAATLPLIEAEWRKVLGAHPQVVALDGSPDPATAAKQFKKWLTKRKIAGAYRMNVEVTTFEEELEDKDSTLNQDKRLTVRLVLRTFGETIPDRVMAFAAEGSATIKVDVGKKLRPADRNYAIKTAVEGAVADAMTASLEKLALPLPKPKK